MPTHFKKTLLLVAITVSLQADQYTLTPDGTFVPIKNGSGYTLTPDKQYVPGNNVVLMPNGQYRGSYHTNKPRINELKPVKRD